MEFRQPHISLFLVHQASVSPQNLRNIFTAMQNCIQRLLKNPNSSVWTERRINICCSEVVQEHLVYLFVLDDAFSLWLLDSLRSIAKSRLHNIDKKLEDGIMLRSTGFRRVWESLKIKNGRKTGGSCFGFFSTGHEGMQVF